MKETIIKATALGLVLVAFLALTAMALPFDPFVPNTWR